MVAGLSFFGRLHLPAPPFCGARGFHCGFSRMKTEHFSETQCEMVGRPVNSLRVEFHPVAPNPNGVADACASQPHQGFAGGGKKRGLSRPATLRHAPGQCQYSLFPSFLQDRSLATSQIGTTSGSVPVFLYEFRLCNFNLCLSFLKLIASSLKLSHVLIRVDIHPFKELSHYISRSDLISTRTLLHHNRKSVLWIFIRKESHTP